MYVIFICNLQIEPMSRRLTEVLRSCFALEPNFISIKEENDLISELSSKFKFMKWNENHFDNKILNYREYMISDLDHFKTLSHLIDKNIRNIMTDRKILPVHVLELRHDGLIKPHIDNKNYSGSIVASLSLQRDSILTLTDSVDNSSSANIFLPRRSLYRQM